MSDTSFERFFDEFDSEVSEPLTPEDNLVQRDLESYSEEIKKEVLIRLCYVITMK